MGIDYLDPHTRCGRRYELTGCIWCSLWLTRPCRGMRNTEDATCFRGYVCIDSISGDFVRIVTLWYHSIYRYQHWHMTHILIIYSPADQARRELSLAAWVGSRLLLRCSAISPRPLRHRQHHSAVYDTTIRNVRIQSYVRSKTCPGSKARVAMEPVWLA